MKEEKCTKIETVDGIEYRYSSSWIHELDPEYRWRLYWRQQKLMDGRIRPGDKILEIGVGSQFTANYLRSRGYELETLDIDEDKKPDIKANVVTWIPEKTYDHLMAFEVFEHIPFEQFQSALSRISTHVERYVFLSIPDCTEVRAAFKIRFGTLSSRTFEWRRHRPVTEEAHYWELGDSNVKQKDLDAVFYECGLQLVETFRFQQWHFFALRRIN